MEVGARNVQGLPFLAKQAPRQSYAPMAPVTLIYQWKNKRGGGGEGWGGKRMILRVNEEGEQENAVLSTWR